MLNLLDMKECFFKFLKIDFLFFFEALFVYEIKTKPKQINEKFLKNLSYNKKLKIKEIKFAFYIKVFEIF